MGYTIPSCAPAGQAGLYDASRNPLSTFGQPTEYPEFLSIPRRWPTIITDEHGHRSGAGRTHSAGGTSISSCRTACGPVTAASPDSFRSAGGKSLSRSSRPILQARPCWISAAIQATFQSR
jgi:hypothetical protein